MTGAVRWLGYEDLRGIRSTDPQPSRCVLRGGCGQQGTYSFWAVTASDSSSVGQSSPHSATS